MNFLKSQYFRILLCSQFFNFLRPWHFIGKKWRDGSLKTDIPVSTLSGQFNVKYTIVSQVNPHVVPFFFNKRGSSGNPSPHRQGQGW